MLGYNRNWSSLRIVNIVSWLQLEAKITYGANLIRMMSIVYLVNIFGKPALYVAHAFVGKIIFFIFIIVLYWYLLTRPTLSIVRDNIKGGKFE